MAPPPSVGKKKNVEDEEWSHGYRPRRDAVRLITKPGEFLVRATDMYPSADIVISAMDDNRKMVNITLKSDAEGWFLGPANERKTPRKFPTIVDLVDHYRAKGLSRTLKLTQMAIRPTWMIKHENVIYEQKDQLGSGNFCTAYKGKYTLKDGKTIDVAVKISLVAQAAAGLESEEAKESRMAMLREAQIMSFYTHENITQFYGIACDHQPLLVLMEFCAGGDLLTHLLKHGKNTDEKEKMVYLYEASLGMFFLHKKQCVHRDLAARNCLISNQGVIKIADFGLSKGIDSSDNKKEDDGSSKNKNGSNAQVPVRWMAPETLLKDAQGGPAYSRASDIWAFGVMTYEVFSNGIKPWPEDPVKYVATQIRKGNMPKLPESTPSKIVGLVSEMWAMDPNKRPVMRQIAKEFNTMLKNSTSSSSGSTYGPKEMTLNKINGVSRTAFFVSGVVGGVGHRRFLLIVVLCSCSDSMFNKVETSGGGPKLRRTQGSKGGKRGSSLRESKNSVDK
ncbi:hypothetical protein PENTCL1PPCAC_13326 [Pristionchus entomophagus]|uniref:Tyrosine-protein kinase n=1 Tax=Pristionchus entomophagus TaxID=358040 RepID=A0AAV5T6G5_9BILA|nr:hypothetical protein PENTCL1PPCAC_13326 [Pristionchus entomophagus]